MPEIPKWAHGRRCVEALAIVLAALMVVLLLSSSHSAYAQTLPKADYRFQNNLNPRSEPPPP